MKQTEEPISNMQQLADEGWLQMKELLRKEGLTKEKKAPVPFLKNPRLFLIIAACLLAFVICLYPFQLQNIFKTSHLADEDFVENQVRNKEPDTHIVKEETIKGPSKLQGKMVNSKRIILNSSNIVYVPSGKNDPLFLDSLVKASLAKKLYGQPTGFATDLKITGQTDSIKNQTFIGRKNEKIKKSFSKKLQVYAGAATNVPSINNSPLSLDLSKPNIHPSITLIIPFDNKFSLHTGLYAMSTIHGKEVSAKEREVVNNMSANLNYNINTTSIIKASYFDLPITLHYQFAKKWSVGTGVQLSQLYKVNVKEQKESYDYNNRLFETTTNTYSSGPASISGTFEKKVAIKSFEPRLVLETDFKKGDWLFSAGYFYGTGKSITLQQRNGTSQQYRNKYFKLGIQYRLGK
ncbi:MAG TPA: hypothetical protein VGW31_08865 [Hanamia sp.]|nr:hypothetical protein [Hanamia sp.]